MREPVFQENVGTAAAGDNRHHGSDRQQRDHDVAGDDQPKPQYESKRKAVQKRRYEDLRQVEGRKPAQGVEQDRLAERGDLQDQRTGVVKPNRL